MALPVCRKKDRQRNHNIGYEKRDHPDDLACRHGSAEIIVAIRI
jgi:hypothetical protein